MSDRDDAAALVDAAEALNTSLNQAWLAAVNAGDGATARAIKTQADRATDQLIDARQALLAAIDSGADLTALLAAMDGLTGRIQAEQQRVSNNTAAMTDVSAVLDAFGQAITLAKQLGG